MEITTTSINRSPGRRAAVNALAAVGFFALLALGILLAIYTARFIPRFASESGGAGAFLSSIFRSNDNEPTLDVVTATSSLPIAAPVVSTTTATSTDTAKTGGSATVPGTRTVTTVVTAPRIDPHGDPDLTVRITDVGYVRRDGDTDTFVSAREIPDNRDGAVKFTVTNAGTNVTGSWKFEGDLPTSPSQHFTSPTQKSLKPGESIDFVLGFEDGREGDDREITITVDPSDKIDESNERNNDASRTIDIDG
jgi:subtilase family serine protease